MRASKLILLSPPFTPARVLRGMDGAWHDPSSFQFGRQDSAATTLLSAVEQPVGYRQDRANANHAIQATAGERPTLSARINRLLKSEDFSNAAWTKVGSTAAPSANTINFPNLNEAIVQGPTMAATVGVAATFQVELSGTGTIYVGISRSSGGVYEETKTLVTLTAAPTVYSVTRTIANASQIGFSGFLTRGTDGTATTVTANKAHLSHGTSIARYQRVNTASDYDTVDFPMGDDFDGTDDSQTCATGGGGTSGFYYAEAFRVQGGAGADRTLFSDAGTNTGFRVRVNSSNKLELAGGNNTTFVTAESAATLSVGSTYILEAWHDGANLNVQINGGAIASSAFAVATAGTAGFTVGKDNGAASSYANGRSYGRVYIKGGKPTDTERLKVRKYLAAKAQLSL